MSELGPTITELEPTATERLRALLTERGVEWRGGLPTETMVEADGLDLLYVALPDGRVRAFIRNYLTPEQAVEATLGRGMLTAEQVHDAVMSADRWEKPMGNTGLTNTHLIVRDDGWQEIADELNSILGSFNFTNSEQTTTVDETWHVGFHMWNGERVTESSIDKWLREFQRKHDELRHIGLDELREIAYALHDDIPMGYEASMRLADWLLHVAPMPNGETCHNASKVMDEHGQARFACSECGAWIDSRMLWNPEYRNGESPWVSGCKLNFCPNCGRRIVGPTTNDVDAEVAE